MASCTTPVTVSSDGGNQAVSGTATDKAGNTAATALNINLDQTAPTITTAVSPAANANGWNNSDVTVSFTCTDALSGIASCPAPVTVSSEGANQTVTGNTTDKAGNSASISVTLNLDKTAPVISSSASPVANSNGWYNSDVTVSYSCTDGLSGIANCASQNTITNEGIQTLNGTATDNAGNTAQTSVTVQLDKTAPALSLSQPADGSLQTSNPFAIIFTPSDDLSLDPNSIAIQVNDQPITVSCVNNAGAYTCTPDSELPSINAQLVVSMADLAGNSGSVQATFSIDSNGDGIPDGQEPPPSTLSTTSSYNSFGLVSSIDGPRTDVNDITTFDYDAQGNLIKTTNALGQVTQITAHDANGRPLTIIDPNGTVTQIAYDARGRMLSRTVAGQTTSYDYDAVGNVIQTTLPNGAYIHNSYDAAHRLVAIEDNLGNRIEYTLDAKGNRVQEDVKDPQATLTRTMSRTYNNLNRLVANLGGANQQTTFGYDANGNQTSITVDPSGLNQLTQQTYDALNRLSSSTNAENGVTSYAYDARNNLISVTDPTGLTTTYTYDGLNRLISQNSPDTGLTTYAYDAAGNRTRQTDARGITMHYNYDALNRLMLIDYPDNSQDVTYVYDNCTNGIGRLCQMLDESGTTDYSYDARGNLVSETTNRDGIIQTIAYAYDSANQLTEIVYPDGRIVDYTRNVIGQIVNATTTLGGTITTLASNIDYKPFGPVADIAYGNGISNTRMYDQDYRLTDLLTTGSNTYQDLTYTLDNANNITTISNGLDSSRSQSFGYDPLNRLALASGVYGDLDYSYDAIGNRMSEIHDGQVKDYTYDAVSHHLLQTQDSGTVTYSYDANGNTTNDTGHDFSYGDNNRLKQASVGGSPVADYVYNGRGERVKKTDIAATYYQYDQSGQLIAETDSLGNTLREYVYVDGMPLAIIEGSNIYTIHTDHLGTPQIITDQSQNIVWQADYEPFGQVNVTTATIENNLRFPGQYYDQETGIQYNWNRYYDSGLGKYITSDRAGLFGGLNSYAYGFNNPTKYIDPWGLWSTAAHNALIRAYGEQHGLTEAQMQAMMRGSAYADSYVAGFQGPDYSFMHAMTSESIPNKADACRLANQFINKNLGYYHDLLSGNLHVGGHIGLVYWNPYFRLGMAMHTVMDSTSPAHSGFQYWDNSQVPLHGPDSFLGVPRNNTEEGLLELHANPALMNQTLNLMSGVMSGDTLDCSCYQ